MLNCLSLDFLLINQFKYHNRPKAKTGLSRGVDFLLVEDSTCFPFSLKTNDSGLVSLFYFNCVVFVIFLSFLDRRKMFSIVL
jgi:hypothetical protein